MILNHHNENIHGIIINIIILNNTEWAAMIVTDVYVRVRTADAASAQSRTKEGMPPHSYHRKVSYFICMLFC